MLIKKNLIFFLPNFSKGGAANSIIRLCEGLDKEKYNIYIISIGKNSYKNRIKKEQITPLLRSGSYYL